MHLNQSKVIFNELEHTYTLDDKQLKGITGIISKYIFPNKYASVSKAVLDEAKKRGSNIHNEIHMSFEGFEPDEPTEEYKQFKQLKYDWLASEYLVSDEQNFASSIDLLDSNLNLFDIKTSYTLDKSYVSWQLSIYAYLFELQNPELKVNKLFGIHLRGEKCKVVEVPRIDVEKVKYLLECAAENKPLEGIEVSNTTVAQISEVESFIQDFKEKLKEMEEQKKVLENSLLNEMKSKGLTKFETGNISFTIKESYTTNRIDSKKLQEEEPEIYNKYLKSSTVKESLIIKIKNND